MPKTYSEAHLRNHLLFFFSPNISHNILVWHKLLHTLASVFHPDFFISNSPNKFTSTFHLPLSLCSVTVSLKQYHSLSYLSAFPLALSTGYLASFLLIFSLTISSSSRSSLSSIFLQYTSTSASSSFT